MTKKSELSVPSRTKLTYYVPNSKLYLLGVGS